MAQIKVTFQQLKDKASDLERLNRSFRDEVENMNNLEHTVSACWEGEARDAFHQAYSDDRTKFEAFAICIDKYVLALREAAQEYEAAERRNVSTGKTRK